MSSGSNTDDQNINLTLSFSKAPFSTVRAFSTSPETYNDTKKSNNQVTNQLQPQGLLIIQYRWQRQERSLQPQGWKTNP